MTENRQNPTLKKEEVLNLTSRTNNGNFFKNDNNIYLLTKTDREYRGVKNKPLYNLFKKEDQGFKYISGLFPTRKENKFSYDVKNNIGFKQFMIAEFKNEGDKLVLRSK